MTFDLLSAVQPDSGWFAIVGIKDGSVRQELVETRDEADAVVQKFVQQERNVFFGVSKFSTGQGRTKDNVQSIKAFWLDIDCGVAKAEVNPKTGRPNGYLTQADGLTALKVFCQKIGLPKPIVVNSGRGVHVYWPLSEEITREEWEPVASRLQKLCVMHNFYIDAQVFEVARVLRVPGTFNFKDEPPQLVEVLNAAHPVNFAALCDCLGVGLPNPVAAHIAPPKRELSDLTKSLMDNRVTSFAKIMRRSGKGGGCQQLWDCYENRAKLDEPRWFDALSIAKFCEDQHHAIHRMSSGHEGYDPVATEQKITHILGPHTCDVFERNNPGGCEGCPHLGKIKSPIVLGREILEAGDDGEGYLPSDAPEGVTKEQGITYVIPKYPEPYFRGVNGGIYLRPKGDEDEPILVYEDDVYVLTRMQDPVLGGVIIMRSHTPHDGVKDFPLTNKQITDIGEIRKELAAQNIMTGRKQGDLLADFVLRSIKALKDRKKLEHMRLQFGWADNNSKFIIGNREITKDGVYHSPPSSTTASLSAMMGPVGTLDKWKEVFNLYGRPGLEPHAFAALTAFGAPLFKFFGQKGAIINLIHPRSGTGKTTILHMCNSVYGSPDGLCTVKMDTFNAKVLRLGILNNLPFTIDEITNMEAKEFSELAYNMTQGRGKDRVKMSANELRANLTSWRTISLCSSNASFYEKLTSLKSSPDGEMMRLLEYKIGYTDTLDPAYAKSMFDKQLLENYGHAGDIYGDYLVKNYEEVTQYALSIQEKLDRELRLTQRERFWSCVAAANIAGGNLAKRLGLLDWDMPAIYDFTGNMILGMREEVQPPVSDVVTVIGDFINRHMQHILVVNDLVDRRSNMPSMPTLEPRGELLIRYEPDTKIMYIAAGPFKEDCVRSQVNYKDTLRQLEARGIYTGTAVKRLSKGMKVASPGTHCLIFDCTASEFLNMDTVVGVDTDDSREG